MVISIKHIDLYQIEEYLINKGEVIANIWELNNDGNPNDLYMYIKMFMVNLIGASMLSTKRLLIGIKY